MVHDGGGNYRCNTSNTGGSNSSRTAPAVVAVVGGWWWGGGRGGGGKSKENRHSRSSSSWYSTSSRSSSVVGIVVLEWEWKEGEWGGGVNQAYSRFSTTHGHITDWKLDLVVYAGVCVWVKCWPVLLGPNDLRPTGLGCQQGEWKGSRVILGVAVRGG